MLAKYTENTRQKQNIRFSGYLVLFSSSSFSDEATPLFIVVFSKFLHLIIVINFIIIDILTLQPN